MEVCAHRGGGESAPLATREAYASSVDSGADYVELDIRRTRDDQLVAFHNDALPETSGRQLLSGLTYPRLCGLAGYQVPTVSDVLGLLAGRVRAHLDLKETGYEDRVLTIAEQALGRGNYLVTSLEEASVAQIKKTFPGVRVGLALGRHLVGAPARRQLETRIAELFPVRRVRRCGADFVAMHHWLARLGTLRRCAAAGVPAMVWTINNDAMIDRYLGDRRVSVVITDRPHYVSDRRDELNGE
ncbi:MAG: glycerophosphodiester phosphodiesterase [Micromonosporaceae bacterium]